MLPQVELARVLAMAAIFLFHLWSVAPEGAGAAGAALSRGYLGVVVFNVITGLVLAWPHLGPAGRPIPRSGEFLRRRFLRILPPYELALALWVAVAAVVAWTPPRAASVAAHAVLVHTLFPADFFAIVPAYWWLGLLAQVYLVFVPLLRFARSVGPWRAAAIVCLTSWGGWLALQAAARPESVAAAVDYMAYYNLPYRLPEFAVGIALASSLRAGDDGATPRLPAAPFAALVGAAGLATVLLGSSERAPLVHVRLVAVCVALFAAVLAVPAFARVGRAAPVARLAAASYGVYLLHQPILGYGVELAGPSLGPRLAFWTALVGGAVAAFALAGVLDRAAAAIAAGFEALASGRRMRDHVGGRRVSP